MPAEDIASVVQMLSIQVAQLETAVSMLTWITGILGSIFAAGIIGIFWQLMSLQRALGRLEGEWATLEKRVRALEQVSVAEAA